MHWQLEWLYWGWGYDTWDKLGFGGTISLLDESRWVRRECPDLIVILQNNTLTLLFVIIQLGKNRSKGPHLKHVILPASDDRYK
jgi:hypothetical protein